jgi:hypothetical protein
MFARVQIVIAGAVLTCGIIAGHSSLLLARAQDPDWRFAGLAVGPFVLAAYGIWATRRSVVASMITCSLVVPVVYYGFEFTSDCIQMSHTLRNGLQLKASFNVKWGMIFLFYGYLPAVIAASVGGAYQELCRKVAISNRRKASIPSGESRPDPA